MASLTRPIAYGGRCQVALIFVVMLSGCAVGPNFQRPQPAARAAFPAQRLGRAGLHDVQQRSATGIQLRSDWWALLGSPRLDALVREALTRNWSLASREAALIRAREQLAGLRGENYPVLAANAQIGRTRIGATEFGPDALTFPVFSSYGAGVTVGYEADIFGRRRRRIEEAAADVEVRSDESDAAALTLVANVALQAIVVASAHRELTLAGSIVASDQRLLNLIGAGYSAGAAADTDVLEVRAQLDHDRAAIPPLQQRLHAALNALATLGGRSPADWSAPQFRLSDFTLPATLPVAVPSTLARQRPDILAAQARLHAASAAVGVAAADLYPQLDLSAAVSREGLLDGPAETAWTLLGGISAPIFNGGRLRAAERVSEAQYRAAFADYQQVVVTALGQIADALSALASDADSLDAQEQALSSARRSFELNRDGYAAGSVDLLRVLDAKRLLDRGQIEVTLARTARLTDTVKLFLALGLHPPDGPSRASIEGTFSDTSPRRYKGFSTVIGSSRTRPPVAW